VRANFISADDLVAAKLASGGPQDIADVDAIRKATKSQRPQAAKKPRKRAALNSDAHGERFAAHSAASFGAAHFVSSTA
jgi:hypothetical protein